MRIFKKEEMLKVPQVARILGVSRRSVYNLIERGPANGGLLAFRFGTAHCLRVPETEVERFKSASVVEEA